MSDDTQVELRDALKAFEIGALDKIIARGSQEDFDALRRLVSGDPDVDPNDRQRAIYALGRWGDPRVVPEIVELLPTLKESHCITAIEALGRLSGDEARTAVMPYAQHRSPHVRKFVVEALSRIDDDESRDAIRTIATSDPSPWLRDLASRRMEGSRSGRKPAR